MAQITNNGNATPIGLPPDKLLEPGETKEIANWDDIKDLPVIAHYVETGVLSVGESAPVPVPPTPVPDNAADSTPPVPDNAADSTPTVPPTPVPDTAADSTPPTPVRNVPNVPRPGGRR